MNRQVLLAILNRAETEDMLFGWEDVSEWPKGTLDKLRAMKLLHPASPASTMDCSDCERECLAAPVTIMKRPNGTRQAYLECPKYGRVENPLHRLNRWQVDIGGLAARLAGVMGNVCEEIMPGRLWMVGELEIGGVRTDVLLARGLGWSDGEQISREARSRKRSQTAVVLVPRLTVNDDVPGHSLEIVPLDEVLCLGECGLSVDVSAIRQAAERAQAVFEVASDGTPERYRYLFKKGVDTWAIVYDGVEVLPPLKNTKGLHYLAFLLAHPGQEGYYALQVVHEMDGTPYEPDEVYSAISADEIDEQGLSISGFTDTGQIMDKEYEKDCRNRLKQAQEKLTRAKARTDTIAIKQAKDEIEQYRRALNEGIGLSGRHRATGDAAERARVAVTQAIIRVLKKLQKQHPALHEHLDSSLQTGTKCSYNPTAPIDWNF